MRAQQRVCQAAGLLPRHGRAVQVDPINPTLKAPVSKRLKVNFNIPLSSFAFKFNLRRYSTVVNQTMFLKTNGTGAFGKITIVVLPPELDMALPSAGAYTRPLLSST